MCLGEHLSRLSVSHAAFNSVGQIATASYDDTVKIHSFEGMGGWTPGHELDEKAMEPNAVVRHNNQTGRWVTMYVLGVPFGFRRSRAICGPLLTLRATDFVLNGNRNLVTLFNAFV